MLRSGRLRVWLVAVALSVGLVFPVTGAHAAAGGPIVLMGIDAEDCGPNAHGPITTYVSVVNSILGSTTNSGSGILVIGGSGFCITGFWNAIDSAVTTDTVTYVSGAAAISSQSLTGFKMLAVVSDRNNTSGGLTPAENDALTARKADVAAFVNGGGGLLGFTQDWFGASTPYGYLADIGSFTFNTGLGYDNITATADGTAIGISDALDVCCWHDEYVTFPSFLKVLATNPATGRAAAIGGVNVVISDIQLAPLAQTADVGTTQTVSATVKVNNVPTAGTTVTFSVLSGPNAGLTGTGVTDANGQASFSYSSSLAGTDTLEASFVDGNGVRQPSNNVTITWEQAGNLPPTVDANGPYSVGEGSSVSLAATGSDPENGPLTYAWDLDNNGTYETAGQSSTFDASLIDGPATRTVGVQVTDNAGLTATDTATVTINNVAPQISALALSGNNVVACSTGNTVGLSFSISDPAPADTHSGSVDWGDGGAAQSFSGSSFSGSHTYAAGTYTITVNAADDDGGTASRSTSAGAVSVLYSTSGFLPPINTSGSRSSFKIGSTIPVKIIVTDCLGAVVADLNPQVWLTKIDSTPDQAVNEVVSSSGADTGNQMRFAGPHYIYNLSTKLSQFCPASMCSSGGDLTAGTYELKVTDPKIAPVVTQLDFRN